MDPCDPNFRRLLKFMSVELVMPSTHLILCCSLLLSPSILPSIRVFSNESALCIRWPNYWSFSFSISPSNEHSGLISFRMDWLDLPGVQGTLKSLFQHHSSKASILSPYKVIKILFTIFSMLYITLSSFFFYSDWMISTTLSCRLLTHSSISFNVLLIPSSVFFTSVIINFISDWFFFYIFYNSLLKFFLCSLIVLLSAVRWWLLSSLLIFYQVDHLSLLEWVAMPSSWGPSQEVFHIPDGFFTVWATREAHISKVFFSEILSCFSSETYIFISSLFLALCICFKC